MMLHPCKQMVSVWAVDCSGGCAYKRRAKKYMETLVTVQFCYGHESALKVMLLNRKP